MSDEKDKKRKKGEGFGTVETLAANEVTKDKSKK